MDLFDWFVWRIDWRNFDLVSNSIYAISSAFSDEIRRDYRTISLVCCCLHCCFIFSHPFDRLRSFFSWMVRLFSRHFFLKKSFLCVRYVFGGVLGPIVLIVLLLILINVIQHYKRHWLPNKLQNWSWLPLPLHSLQWYDQHLFAKVSCCCKKKKDVIVLQNNLPIV